MTVRVELKDLRVIQMMEWREATELGTITQLKRKKQVPTMIGGAKREHHRQ